VTPVTGVTRAVLGKKKILETLGRNTLAKTDEEAKRRKGVNRSRNKKRNRCQLS